ncbi:hypothetical protein QQ045_008225 [Rhodiola kirilowii]
MAFRRSLATRASFFARRANPSFSYVLRDDDSKHQTVREEESSKKFGSFVEKSEHKMSRLACLGIGGSRQGTSRIPFCFPDAMGPAFSRNMSTTIGESADKIGYVSDVAEMLTDKTVEVVASQAPAVNEVAIAAADSFFPVAALQYLIDGVHNVTGLPWWASIALTTLMIRSAVIPVLIKQLKATSQLTLMRPHLEAIKQEMDDKSMDPDAMAEGKRKMNKLFMEYGVTPWTPMKGLLIQGPVFISFFLGISNMAEKVPSFKTGGALWFTDLTTPDSLYIFPVLTALTFLITVECNMQEGMEGNPMANTMKKFSRVIAVVTVPFTMSFPKAVFCYWITSNIFSLCYGLVIKRPAVKKYFNIPIIAPPPPSDVKQPAFSFSEVLKKYKEMQEKAALAASSADTPKITDRKLPASSSSPSAISQRLKTLEKQVKGRKKPRKLS